MNFDKIYRKRFYRKIDVQENMGNNFRVIIDQRVLDLTDFVKVVKCGLVNTVNLDLITLRFSLKEESEKSYLKTEIVDRAAANDARRT